MRETGWQDNGDCAGGTFLLRVPMAQRRKPRQNVQP